MKLLASRSAVPLVWALVLLVPGCSRPSAGAEAQAAPSPSSPSARPEPVPMLPHPVLDRLHDGGVGSIADIAERVTNSVVSVQTTRVLHARVGPPGFGLPFGPSPLGPQGEERRTPGLGSGVVVASGVVVTNHHVVADAESLRVTARDGREYPAEIVGSDAKSDLAVLRIVGEAPALQPLPMGDSSRLRLGDVVLAVGNPFGVGQTVTMGIVSAQGRSDLGINAYEDFIQTDAAINPGNSGGALVNMRGELVGINTAILSRSGGSQGIGFAIPSAMARPIVESLLATGKVSRGWLGVGIQDVDANLAEALRLPKADGVLIADVEAGTPAASAGLRRGDVIVAVNGQLVDSSGRLRNLIASTGASKPVKLALFRDGKPLELSVTLGALPETAPAAAAPTPVPPPTAKPLDGLTVAPLDAAMRRRQGIPDGVAGGVVIMTVVRGSAADRAGLRPGDLILDVDLRPITSVESFASAWSTAKGKRLLTIRRGGVVRLVAVVA